MRITIELDPTGVPGAPTYAVARELGPTVSGQLVEAGEAISAGECAGIPGEVRKSLNRAPAPPGGDERTESGGMPTSETSFRGHQDTFGIPPFLRRG